MDYGLLDYFFSLFSVKLKAFVAVLCKTVCEIIQPFCHCPFRQASTE